MRRRYLILGLAIVAGCSGGSGTPVAPIVGGATAKPSPVTSASPSPVAVPSPTPVTSASPTATPTATPASTPTPTPTPSPTMSAASTCVGQQSSTFTASGGMVAATAAMGTLDESATANQFTSASVVTLCYVAQSNLPAPLLRAPHRSPDGRFEPLFTQGAGNTYVAAFMTTFTGGQPTSGLSIAGDAVAPASIPAGTQLNIAQFNGTTWVDVGTALESAGSNFQSTPPTVALPGVVKAGTYLIYEPAVGTNTSQIDLGFALLADDGSGATNGLQFAQIEDQNGNAYPTPTTTFFPLTGTDLDGQSLTPDASRGAVVDGSNAVYFFSGIPQHAFTVSPNTVDVSQYGGDGDSIASLPSGDEVVVSADNGGPLAVISGILAGSPVVADTIAIPSSSPRDGLVLSNDGKVLLSRGYSGIDVYAVTTTSPHAGSTGQGTTSATFTLVTTLASPGSVSTPTFEDGRDGMALSPADSSRAVIIGQSASDAPVIQLITGLTSSGPVVNVLHPRIPSVRHSLGRIVRSPEPSGHRRPFALTPSAASQLYGVTITPDGTTAYVSTDAGIITVAGVNTGTLTQVGSPYAPTLTVSGGSTCTLEGAPTLGVLPDGKYLVVSVDCGEAPGTTDATQGSGTLVTVPIGSGHALGAPVGQLNQVVTPLNDQMIVH